MHRMEGQAATKNISWIDFQDIIFKQKKNIQNSIICKHLCKKWKKHLCLTFAYISINIYGRTQKKLNNCPFLKIKVWGEWKTFHRIPFYTFNF